MYSEDDLIINELDLSRGWEWQNGKRGPCRLGFFFPQQGRGAYCGGQMSQPFSAGDVVVLNMSASGRIQRRGRDPLVVAFFAAFLEELGGIFPLRQFCAFKKAVTRTASPLFFPASGALGRKCHALVRSAPPTQDVEHRCHTLRVVAQVFEEQYGAMKAQEHAKDRTGSASREPLKPLTLEQIAASTCGELAKNYQCSQRHLNRLVNASFGLSVSALKMEMRLLKAAALLRDSGTKIGAVASDCGFNHVNLFSSRFRKRFGESPKQWRQRFLSVDLDFGPGKRAEVCLLQEKGLCPMLNAKSKGDKGNTDGESVLAVPMEQTRA